MNPRLLLLPLLICLLAACRKPTTAAQELDTGTFQDGLYRNALF